MMQNRSYFFPICSLLLCGAFAVLAVPMSLAESPTPAAAAAFNAYKADLEARLARQHQSSATFLGSVLSDPGNLRRLRSGDPIVERIAPPVGAALPGALLHHWRATAFVPLATADDFTRLMQDFVEYPRIHSPQVVGASVLAQGADRYEVLIRLRQRHVFTVTMDTTYEVSFGELDAEHRYSASRSTNVAEIGSRGHALSAADEHGFLWRQNTYWSCEERDGGLYLQIESVSLTRSIPAGLGWATGRLIERVPRDSLTFTLRATSAALHGQRVAETP
jgi:hypothetical protein